MHKLTVPAVAEKVPSLSGRMEDKDLESCPHKTYINVQYQCSGAGQQRFSAKQLRTCGVLYFMQSRGGALVSFKEQSPCPQIVLCSNLPNGLLVHHLCSLVPQYDSRRKYLSSTSTNALKGCSFSCQGAALHAAPKSLACAASRLAHPPNKLENDLRQDSFEHVRTPILNLDCLYKTPKLTAVLGCLWFVREVEQLHASQVSHLCGIHLKNPF